MSIGKLLSCVGFLMLLFVMHANQVFGASHIAHFVLEPNVKTAQVGSTFYINVVLSLNQPQGVIDGTLNFIYNKEFLEIESVIPSLYYWSNLQYAINQTSTGTSIPFHNEPAYTSQTKPNNRSDTLILLVVRAKQATTSPVTITLGTGTVTTGMTGGWDVISPATVEIKSAPVSNPAFIPLTHPPSPTPIGQTPYVIVQMTKDDKLIPQNVSVNFGGVVRFINKDNEGPHRAREVNGLFDSYYMSYNQFFDYKFTQAGVYTVFDPAFEGNPNMKGTITVGSVTGSPTNTPTPTPTITVEDTFGVTVTQKNSTHPQFGIGSAFGYVIDGVQGKELTLVRGRTYAFNVSAVMAEHPFYLTTSSVGTGLLPIPPDNTSTDIMMYFTPTASTPNLIYYNCEAHPSMGWKINIVNSATSTPTNTPTPIPNPYDITGDNEVTVADYNLLLSRFGQSATQQEGNYNNNQKIDIFDYNILIKAFAS